MVKYIPHTHIPITNVCQEIQNARSREINEEVDIQIPPYVVDRRILRSIEYGNLEYLERYLQQCPRNIERYFFLETVLSTSPLVRSVLVSNLLGFSLLYRSHKCLRMLLDHGSDPFQATYFIEYTSQGEQQRKILLYEAPAFLLLTGSIQPRHRAVCIALLVELRVSDAEFHIPITLRRQQMEPPQEPVSATIRFADAWECLDKEIEKKGGDDLAQNKVLLRELKAVYRANKFDRLDQPNVEK
ncbi:hypothetical protein CSKR_104698 [Clonorchis sinensis]|uniref:Uncharacterized protein n=1 Tax=Clonorchis sinensis TaxID=79923 RepID=A0A3R7DDL6_CLOSI|nr:hypothetical protein CSKR_104698 [Clonorchis sinensis]